MHLKCTLGALAITLVAACETQKPLPVATLAYSPTQICTPTPDLSEPIPLTSETPTGQIIAQTIVNQETKCLSSDDGPDTPYKLFAIPQATNTASINAGTMLDHIVVPVTVSTLDANGEVVRSYSMNDMVRRGSTQSVLLRPVDEEAYILIQVDPSLIGDAYQIALNSTDFTSDYSYFGKTYAKVYFADPVSPES